MEKSQGGRAGSGHAHLGVEAAILGGPRLWIALTIVALGAGWNLVLRPLMADDAWITFRVAENIANGQGYVYNLGERRQVTTTPLFTLMLAGAARAGFAVPQSAMALSAAASGVGAAAMFALLAPVSLTAGIGAATTYLFLPFLSTTQGMETALVLALALSGLWLYRQRKVLPAATLLALATLTRADCAVLVALVGIHATATGRRVPFSALALYLALLAPWLVFNWWYFGQPLPSTLEAKQAMQQAAGWRTFIPAALAELQAHFRPGPAWIGGALAILGFGLGLRRDWRLGLLPAWSTLHSAGYELLQVPYFHWYWAPLLPTIAMATGLGAGETHRLLSRSVTHRVGAAIATALLAVPLVGWGVQAAERGGFNFVAGRYAGYEAVGRWLAAHGSADDWVGVTEMGIVGYFSGLPVVDFVGLTHQDVVDNIGQGLKWTLFERQPRYVVVASFERWLLQYGWFSHRYAVVPAFAGREVELYERRSAGPLPRTAWRRIEDEFDGVARLESARLGSAEVRAGEPVEILLRWVPGPRWSTGYSSFVHVVDQQFDTKAQSDNWLEIGPNRSLILDPHWITLPPDLPPGSYGLHIGVYRRSPYEGLKRSGPGPNPQIELVVRPSNQPER